MVTSFSLWYNISRILSGLPDQINQLYLVVTHSENTFLKRKFGCWTSGRVGWLLDLCHFRLNNWCCLPCICRTSCWCDWIPHSWMCDVRCSGILPSFAMNAMARKWLLSVSHQVCELLHALIGSRETFNVDFYYIYIKQRFNGSHLVFHDGR